MKAEDRNTTPPQGQFEQLKRRVGELESELAATAGSNGVMADAERTFQDLLMDAAPVFFVAIDGEGRTLRMNGAMLEALGYTAGEIEGTDYLTTFVPEADRPKLAEVFSQLTVDRQQTLNENRILKRSGEELIVEWHGRPVLDSDGQLQCFFGVGLDMTEQRRSQEEIKARRDEAQEYLDLAGVIFLGLDREGRVSQINRQGCEVLGGTEEQIVGLRWVDHFVPERQRQQVREVFATLMSGDVGEFVGEYENELVALGGERRFIEWHNAIERDPEGNIIGTMSSGIDITDRRHAEDVQRLAYKIGSAIHTVGSVQELFGRIREELGDVMNTENFFIALYNRSQDTLSLSYFVDEKDQDDFDSFPAGKTLTGYIIKHDTSLLIDRKELDKWTEAGVVDMVGTPSLIWLGVPLRVSGEVIGALVVQSYTDAKEFGEAEKEMLEFVSGQIGFAIEHKRAEDELMASEAKNRSILDAVPDMMFSIGRDGVFKSYDAPGDAPLAMPPDAFIDKHVTEVFPPEFATQLEASIAQVFQTDEIQLMEYSIPIPAPDGDLRDFEARMVPSGGDTVLGVVRDITDKRRADRFLRTLNDAALGMERQMTPEEIFAAAAAKLTEVGLTGTLFLTDETGELISRRHTSRDPEKLRAAEKLLGGGPTNYPAPVDEVDAFRRAIRNRETVYVDDGIEFLHQELPLPKKKFAPQMQRVLDIQKLIIAPLTEDDRVFGALAVGSDKLSERDVPAITAFTNQLSAAWRKAKLMKELESSIEELRETQDQLLQAQKMEAVGRLAGGVAHDFNNLLTAISGYAELLSCDSSLSERVHGDIDQIRKAAEQAAALTRQLLAFSRRQPLQPVVMDLNKIVVDMNAMLRRLIGEDIELVTALGRKLVPHEGGPGTARAGHHQSGRQRAGRHAGRRPPDHLDRVT